MRTTEDVENVVFQGYGHGISLGPSKPFCIHLKGQQKLTMRIPATHLYGAAVIVQTDKQKLAGKLGIMFYPDHVVHKKLSEIPVGGLRAAKRKISQPGTANVMQRPLVYGGRPCGPEHSLPIPHISQ